MADNHVCVTGNVTRDVDLKYLANGQPNARLGVAVNRRWQDRQSGDWKEETSFLDVICWRDLAENVAETVVKGTRVTVNGRLEQRSWNDKETDAKRSVVEIVADDVAVSLRWATAVVTKTERSSNGATAGTGMSL